MANNISLMKAKPVMNRGVSEMPSVNSQSRDQPNNIFSFSDSMAKDEKYTFTDESHIDGNRVSREFDSNSRQ
jgi:hypothetical protein